MSFKETPELDNKWFILYDKYISVCEISVLSKDKKRGQECIDDAYNKLVKFVTLYPRYDQYMYDKLIL